MIGKMYDLLDRRYKSWYYNNRGGTMNEKRIEEILQDPNTWEWDGCTYSDADIDSSYLDRTFEEIFKKAKDFKSA
jgi:hypothetical protein